MRYYCRLRIADCIEYILDAYRHCVGCVAVYCWKSMCLCHVQVLNDADVRADKNDDHAFGRFPDPVQTHFRNADHNSYTTHHHTKLGTYGLALITTFAFPSLCQGKPTPTVFNGCAIAFCVSFYCSVLDDLACLVKVQSAVPLMLVLIESAGCLMPHVKLSSLCTTRFGCDLSDILRNHIRLSIVRKKNAIAAASIAAASSSASSFEEPDAAEHASPATSS